MVLRSSSRQVVLIFPRFLTQTLLNRRIHFLFLQICSRSIVDTSQPLPSVAVTCGPFTLVSSLQISAKFPREPKAACEAWLTEMGYSGRRMKPEGLIAWVSYTHGTVATGFEGKVPVRLHMSGGVEIRPQTTVLDVRVRPRNETRNMVLNNRMGTHEGRKPVSEQ